MEDSQVSNDFCLAENTTLRNTDQFCIKLPNLIPAFIFPLSVHTRLSRPSLEPALFFCLFSH